MNHQFEKPNEIAILTTVLYYETGLKKLSDEKYEDYQRILRTFRESRVIHPMDSDMVKLAIEDFISEMDKETLQSILTKLQ